MPAPPWLLQEFPDAAFTRQISSGFLSCRRSALRNSGNARNDRGEEDRRDQKRLPRLPELPKSPKLQGKTKTFTTEAAEEHRGKGAQIGKTLPLMNTDLADLR